MMSITNRATTIDNMYPTVDLASVRSMLSSNSIPTVMLFAGPNGVGKTTLARIIAAQFLKLDAETSVKLIRNPREAQVMGYYEHDLTRFGKADDISKLAAEIESYTEESLIERRGFFLLDEMDAVSEVSQRKIIKPFEEYNLVGKVCIVITTNYENKLEPAVLSRAQKPFEFNELESKSGIRFLKEAAESAKRPISDSIAETLFLNTSPFKSPRSLLNSLESYLATGQIRERVRDARVSDVMKSINNLAILMASDKPKEDDKAVAVTALYEQTKRLAFSKASYEAIVASIGTFYAEDLADRAREKKMNMRALELTAITMGIFAANKPRTYTNLIADLMTAFYHVAEARAVKLYGKKPDTENK